jgi:hypothetical protein
MATETAVTPLGWSGEFLLPLVADEDCLMGLAALTEDIINGRLDDRARNYLLVSNLIAIPKPSTGVRPIAIGEVFFKLSALFVLLPLRPVLVDIFGAQQLGVGVPGGSEVAASILRFLLQDPATTRAGVLHDLRNAFNEIDRAAVLQALFDEPRLNKLWRMVAWAYGSPSFLWVHGPGGDIIAVLLSSQGVRQGDALAALLFALAVHPAFLRALAIHADTVHLVAIMDDATLVGPADHVIACSRRLAVEMHALNLEVQLTKYQGVWFHEDEPPDVLRDFMAECDAPLRTDAVRVVGAIFGPNDDAVHQLLSETLAEYDAFFQSIAHPEMPAREASLLISMCGIPKMNFLSRTTDPRRLAPKRWHSTTPCSTPSQPRWRSRLHR